MKKQIKKATTALVLGAAVLGAAGAATAAVEINIYGASAQYLFWNDAADNFLSSLGCSNIRQSADTIDPLKGKNGVSLGDACTGAGNQNVIIRYSAKASFDGPLAIMGDSSMAGSSEKCNEGDAGVPAGKAGFYRKMANEATISGGKVNGLKCVDITLGASDVAGESFIQQSHGLVYGPNPTNKDLNIKIDRVFTGINTAGLTTYQPVVVPFGFFINNSVEVAKCADGANKGGLCMSDADCDNIAGACVTAKLDNISRSMAVQIFSGQAWYWTDFGGSFTAEPIVACLRHAGSGTHATMDLAVMHGAWGGATISQENAADPTIWFNDGSSDEMACVNALSGAIGYADADQSVSSYTSTHAVTYNGVAPRRSTIRNGQYDFFSAQWLYEDPSEPNYATTHPVVVALTTYAADPANIPSTKAAYWAAKDEMIYLKDTDFDYPKYVGAANPQTP